MDIVLIGSGNVAAVFGQRLAGRGHSFVQVLGRSRPRAEALASALGALAETDPGRLTANADIYLLAVSDAAVYELAETLRLGDAPVLHTSGATPMGVLSTASSRYGVLYPLQSLRQEVGYPESIPMLVDGSDDGVFSLVRGLAGDIGSPVVRADDAHRLRLHLAAVFANNFTNYLFTLAEGYCRREDLDFGLLLPIIRETVRRLDKFSPAAMQTGPAARGDLVTIERHRALLDGELRDWYDRFTAAITRSSGF